MTTLEVVIVVNIIMRMLVPHWSGLINYVHDKSMPKRSCDRLCH